MVALRPQLAAIPAYVPGLRIEEVQRKYGLSRVVKLASNECPLPPFEPVLRLIPLWAAELNRYPDNDCWDLREALALHLHVGLDNLLIGNGSGEVLLAVFMAAVSEGDAVVFPHPSFLLYRIYCAVMGARAVAVPLRDGRHDVERMAQMIDRTTRLAIVCNPNNPTGTYVTSEELNWFLDTVPDHVLVVVDEAYYEYADAGDYPRILPGAIQRPNVLVLRTFSKIYGLAGLRVGYGVGHELLVSEIRKVQGPFTVNEMAQRAARESLKHQDLVRERAALNAQERNRLYREYGRLGLEFFPSQGNFIYVRLGRDNAGVQDYFLRHGVIVRSFTGDGWFRITIGLPEENNRLLEVVEGYLASVALR
jgi:histidinol-phosphate aminotransferase